MSRKGRYVRTPEGSFRDRTTGKFVSKAKWEREKKSLRKPATPKALRSLPKQSVEVLPFSPMERTPSGVLKPKAATKKPVKAVKPVKKRYVRTPSGAIRDRQTGRFVPKEKWEKERKRLRRPTIPRAPEAPKDPRVPEEVLRPPEEMDWPEEYPEVFEVDDEDYDSA